MSSEDSEQRHPDRLATAVKNRRESLGLTSKQLATTAGLSARAVAYLEAGDHDFHPLPTTLAGLDRALRWTPGSARRIYERGGRPGVRPHPKTTTKPRNNPTEARVVTAARLPRPVELTLLEHLAARRQDMEAVLEAEARMLVELLGPMITGRNPGGKA